MTRPLFSGLILASRIFGRLSRESRRLARRWEPSDTQQKSVIASTAYDMSEGIDETYYADQYWASVSPFLDELPGDATVLDLGCGQGRLTLRLAGRFPSGKVLGCDLSEAAIQKAREHAARASATNASFATESISSFLARQPAGGAHAIVMTEVAFFYPGWIDDLPGICRALRPGGLFVISARSQLFDALCVARDKLWDSVPMVLAERAGTVFGPPMVFSWHASGELRSILAGAGLEVVDLTGIGVCSGIPGDPHDHVCIPSKLTRGERNTLMELELGLGRSVPDAGRYILAISRRSQQTSSR